jgi:homoserine O-acetyltransferase/O-succinyltransferase
MPAPKWRFLVVGLLVCIFEIGSLHVAAALDTYEGDYVIQNFHFRSAEMLPQLRLHYRTLGQPMRDAQGHVSNAVLILHGTGGTGRQFLRSEFADVVFKSGGLLDPAKYFIILPDSIGHGISSKPSDGLHARFPQYDYGDMVRAQYDLVVQGLGIDHLRLVMGTSMGCMHTFIWGETYPDFMDALMPLACLPIEIAGRNRIWRKMIIDAIRGDPAWAGGEYKTEPREGIRAAADLLLIASSAPHEMQKAYPSRDAADKYLDEYMAKELATLDANDLLYQLNASGNYNPSAALDEITARVVWVNSADDFINPPELRVAEQEAKRLKNGRFVLIPIGDQTHGHRTYAWAAIWNGYLQELLATLPLN